MPGGPIDAVMTRAVPDAVAPGQARRWRGVRRDHRFGPVAADQLYNALIKRRPGSADTLPAAARAHIPANGARLVTANALQSSGDQVVNASTVLPWLFAVLGVPPALTGLLVPIRESGSMLPQVLLTPLVLRARRRTVVFVVGALVQAGAAGAMAVVAAAGHGLGAGIAILVALTVFALGRSLCSISAKDVQGRTIPKGERGQINGLATTASGLVAITVGVGVRVLGGGELSAGQLAWLLAGGAALWLLAAAIYRTIREPADEPDPDARKEPSAKEGGEGWAAQLVGLLRDDRPFRHFVVVRALLLVSALSPPLIVTLSVQSGAGTLSGLGGFIIASGLSALLGGPIFGRLADRSSRRLMAWGAALASVVIVVLVVLTAVPGFDGATWAGAALFVTAYFLLRLVHTGVRVGRKTYVVDMAEGDQRATYVAVSNSAMGVILLVAGAVSSLLSVWGIHWALLFLAALGLVGVVAAARLPEVSQS